MTVEVTQGEEQQCKLCMPYRPYMAFGKISSNWTSFWRSFKVIQQWHHLMIYY